MAVTIVRKEIDLNINGNDIHHLRWLCSLAQQCEKATEGGSDLAVSIIKKDFCGASGKNWERIQEFAKECLEKIDIPGSYVE